MGSYYIHQLDAIAFNLWGISFYWYWLFYLIGFFWVYWAGGKLINQGYGEISLKHFHKMCWITWIALFVGSRLFYIIVYHLDYFIQRPAMIFKIWHGGMSFHGALIGVILVNIFYARRLNFSVFSMIDLLATIVPLALMLGRIGNFINGELVGRETEVPWAIVFPLHGGYVPRHPSQLYGALVEGVLLFVILYSQRRYLRIKAYQSILFLFAYGLGRFIVGFFRAFDPQIGAIWLGLSLGQLFCLAMIGGALFLEYHYAPFATRWKKNRVEL